MGVFFENLCLSTKKYINNCFVIIVENIYFSFIFYPITNFALMFFGVGRHEFTFPCIVIERSWQDQLSAITWCTLGRLCLDSWLTRQNFPAVVFHFFLWVNKCLKQSTPTWVGREFSRSLIKNRLLFLFYHLSFLSFFIPGVVENFKKHSTTVDRLTLDIEGLQDKMKIYLDVIKRKAKYYAECLPQ